MDDMKFTEMICPECNKTIYADKTAASWFCGYCGSKIRLAEKQPAKKAVVKVKLKRHAVHAAEAATENTGNNTVKVTFEETLIESAEPAKVADKAAPAEEAKNVAAPVEKAAEIKAENNNDADIEKIDEEIADKGEIIDIEEDEITVVDRKPEPKAEVKPAAPIQEKKPEPKAEVKPAAPVQEKKPEPKAEVKPAAPVQEKKPEPKAEVKPAAPVQDIKSFIPERKPVPAAHAHEARPTTSPIPAAHAPVQSHTPTIQEDKRPEFDIKEEVKNDQLLMVLEKYNGKSARVTIPEEVDRIAPAAFKGNSFVQSVFIHDEVKEIGGSAFEDCVNLSEVSLPKKLSRLNFKVFRGCKSLKSITIPASVDAIMNDALDCAVTEITFEDSETKWELEDEFAGGAFNVDRKGTGEGVSKLIFKGVTYPAVDVLRSKSIANYLRSQDLCPRCGGKFGLFSKCKGCGFKKNY